MDLALLPRLLELVAAGLILGALGATLPAFCRRRGITTGGALAAAGAAAAMVYVGLGVSMSTWRDHPADARAATMVGAVLLAMGCLRFARGQPGADEDGDDGGQRRPRPTPPPRPLGPGAGPDPAPAGGPWADFDSARSGWERDADRVPAGA